MHSCKEISGCRRLSGGRLTISVFASLETKDLAELCYIAYIFAQFDRREFESFFIMQAKKSTVYFDETTQALRLFQDVVW